MSPCGIYTALTITHSLFDQTKLKANKISLLCPVQDLCSSRETPKAMENSHSIPHAIMFPLPYQGHVTPCIHLAMKLASKGFTITFINTQKIHQQIAKSQPNNSGEDIFQEARRSGLNIRYKTMSDGFPLSFDRMKNNEQFMASHLSVLPALVDELVGSIIKSDPSVSCLIADSSFVWNSHIAYKYNLVNISFWTEPALVFNLYYFLDLLKINGHYASKGNPLFYVFLYHSL